MAKGPGKYDEFVTQVRKATGADLALVVVLGGTRGQWSKATCRECRRLSEVLVA